MRKKAVVQVLFGALIAVVAGDYLWVSVQSSPENRVSRMTSVKLPENSRLVYKHEQSNIMDYVYVYTFQLDRKRNCEEIGLIEYEKLNEGEKIVDGKDLRDFFADKFIQKSDIACIHVESNNDVQFSFSAVSDRKYITVVITSR